MKVLFHSERLSPEKCGFEDNSILIYIKERRGKGGKGANDLAYNPPEREIKSFKK